MNKQFKLPKNNTHFDRVLLHPRATGAANILRSNITIENSGLDQASQELAAIYVSETKIQIIGNPANGSTLIPFDNLK